MPLQIIKSEVTDINADALVSVENESSYYKSRANSLYAKAGRCLKKERRIFGECIPGNAIITSPGKLNSKYVIHTSIPNEFNENHDETTLSSCYNSVLSLAKDKDCASIAIPLLYMDFQGFNKEKALKIAVDTISEFLNVNDMMIYLSVPDKSIYQIDINLQSDLEKYIRDVFFEPSILYEAGAYANSKREKRTSSPKKKATEDILPYYETESFEETTIRSSAKYNGSLIESLKHLDESFSEMLLRKIDSSGMTDAECYKKANIDRKLFSKIRSDKLYRPSKQTVIAFSIALELSLEETKEMLMKAGFALSHSNKFDVIIEYFIKAQDYNIYKINEALYEFDQPLLGM